MDPISHLVFGRAIEAISARSRPHGAAPPRGRTAAVVIGSIAPDADCVFMPTGWDRYLLWHERGTHALLGTALDGLALATLMWFALRGIDRYRARRRSPAVPSNAAPAADMQATRVVQEVAADDLVAIDPPASLAPAAAAPPLPRFAQLWRAAWLGALGHITLDIVSGGTIRLFAPLSAMPFTWPLTAMADPLLALPLLAFLIASLVWKQHVRRLAVATMCLLASVLAVKAVSERMARDIYARDVAAVEPGLGGTRDSSRPWSSSRWIGPRLELRAVEARWGSFTGWMFYDRTPKELRAWSIDVRRGTTSLVLRRRFDTIAPYSAHDADIIAFSRRLDTVSNLFTLFDLTFVETRPREQGVTDVLWTDIRFCGPERCALWFGGTFDAEGNAREQFVLVGGLRQSRPFVPRPLF